MNEAGAPFAGDATGLRWCVVAVGVTVWTGGTTVSRAFHGSPGPAALVSRAFHAWLAHPSPHIPEDAPEPRPNSTDRHEGWHVGPIGGSLNPSMRTLTP